MKYLLVLLGLLSSLLALPAQAALKVFACEPEWGALTQELGGSLVSVYSATTAQQDPHHIEARPSLLARTRNADLLICTGAGLEAGWLPVLLAQSGNAKVQTGQPGWFMATDGLALLEKPIKLDRAMGDVHAAGNPHIQQDPHMIAAVAQRLNQRLQQIDPANAAAYQHNYDSFNQRWQAAMARWQQEAAPLRGKLMVSHHKAFSYLYHWLGMTEVGTLEPLPGIDPSAQSLATLLQQLKGKNVYAIVRAPYNDARASEWLHDHIGAPAVELPFTIGGEPGTDNLFGFFDVTVKRLLEAH